jgi:hypothetical protein
MSSSALNRRQFLITAGAAAALGCGATGRGPNVSIVAAPGDTVAAAAPSRWAVKELQDALTEQGASVHLRERLDQVAAGERCIVAAGSNSPLAREVLDGAGLSMPQAPESLGLVAGKASGREVLLACGADARGLVYALLDLADRVQIRADPEAALDIRQSTVESPANTVRSVARLFVSDVEDKPWFNDRQMWPAYLTMLAAQRFNRFNLSVGIGYDFLRNVTDAYFLFAYPFLLSVPGYDVRAAGLPDEERDRNLELLKFISEETVARGIEFQLGIWMHGYEWINSPNPNYTIEGLTKETHGAYCRDALTALLQACPAISGVTFRIHGESGVPEASYNFWKTVFDGVVRCGRQVEIDMHAKGMDQSMIDVALGTGMPVKISPKYWAEHLGMPYHQAAIREQEMPRETRDKFFALSSGSRRFLRYGYGDLLREDRRYGILHRIWPGTQRLLVWGDPVTAAAYSRAFSFCGSDGVEIHEPLSFKGRRGTGIPGGRCAYADKSLSPRWDWEKYRYSYRVWGRHLYNPDADREVCRRFLDRRFGPAAEPIEGALANAGRILPIVTTTHDPSAANNTYWPEVYLNQPIVDPAKNDTYGDTPAPKVFGNVSPLDPQLFSRINDFADELLKGERSGKYSPVEVAAWLEDFSEAAAQPLSQADAQSPDKTDPDYRRMTIDAAIQAGLGRFFAAKFRSAVLYAIHERSGDRAALEQALEAYRGARASWAELAERAKGIYVPDITVGEHPSIRGHWLDRLPAMDDDIADMAKKLESTKAGGTQSERVRLAIAEATGRPQRAALPLSHTPPKQFTPGRPLEVEISVEGDSAPKLHSPLLYYRHVNQAERYLTAEMRGKDGRYSAAVPGRYTDSPYPIQYYFEVTQGPDKAWLYPGFAPDLTNQPYFLVRRSTDQQQTA